MAFGLLAAFLATCLAAGVLASGFLLPSAAAAGTPALELLEMGSLLKLQEGFNSGSGKPPAAIASAGMAAPGARQRNQRPQSIFGLLRNHFGSLRLLRRGLGSGTTGGTTFVSGSAGGSIGG